MEKVAGSKGQGASVESQELSVESGVLVKSVSEDVIRHGFAEPLTEAGEGYEWAWVGMNSSYKGWWVAVKVGCTPFAVVKFAQNEIEDGSAQTWKVNQEVQGRTVIKAGGWWVAVKCDG